MKRLVGVLMCVALLGMLPARETWAGWVIEQMIRSGAGGAGAAGDGDRQALTLSSNRMKTVVMDRAGRPMVAWIMDLDAQTLTSVNYEQKSVTSGTIQEYSESLRGATAAMTGQMAEAMKQMQEAMKNMPPEQRQQMEQMLRKSMPSGFAPGQAPSVETCRQPQVEVRPTGQRATIAGFAAIRYDAFEDGKLAREVRVSPAITAWRELDAQKMERFSQAMRTLPIPLRGFCGN
jgi:hypothetical protein